VVQEHFESAMATPLPRSGDFSWPDLDLPAPDLSSLDRPFSDDEIWHAICQLPHDKAPSPDGFTKFFLQEMLAHNTG
jgi:hypothetical protein